MQWVSGEACEALIRSFAFRCSPVTQSTALSANWIGWPFLQQNQIDCISPKRFCHFNYHKFVILRPSVIRRSACKQRCRIGQWHRNTPFVWNAVDHYILSTVLWLSLRWHISEEDITVTNETPQTLDGLGRAWKVRSGILCAGVRMCVCGCKCVKVVSAVDDNNIESSVQKTRSSGPFCSPRKSM